jgi:hypothetical protein
MVYLPVHRTVPRDELYRIADFVQRVLEETNAQPPLLPSPLTKPIRPTVAAAKKATSSSGAASVAMTMTPSTKVATSKL